MMIQQIVIPPQAAACDGARQISENERACGHHQARIVAEAAKKLLG
jgi:hypothetical protein